jgi:ribosomal protein S18 acetylase RimI-like enzyme
VNIRSFGDADWPRVREIYDLAKPDEIGTAIPRAAVLRLEDDPPMLELFRESTVLVAESEGEVIGFGGNRDNYISWLFVHPEHRRKGVARLLLSRILARLQGPVTLNVLRDNEAARQLYDRLGFKVAREIEGEFNGHPVHVMTLRFDL